MSIPYPALRTSSSSSGFPLVTITPRFILAGSRAQLEIPTNATLLSRATNYAKYFKNNEKL